MKRLTLDPWGLALLLLLGLAWHGGLHAWQIFAASAGIAVLWGTAAERQALKWQVLLVFVAIWVWQTLVSVQVQVSWNQCAWLMALVVLAETLRRQPKPTSQSLAWVVGLAVLAAAALFSRAAWVLHLDPGKVWAGTELVAVATHWFFPNQNLLVVGVLLPGILVALAWIYGGREGRGDPARTGVMGWTAWVLIGAAIVYAGSRGGLLALAGGGAWWLGRAWRRDGLNRRLALIALLLAVTLGFSWRSPLAGLQRRAEANAGPQGADSFRYQRLKFWKASLLASAQRPFLGWGQGSYAEAIQRQDTGGELSPRNPIARYRLRLVHAHNELLETAVELGWPAALLLSALALAFFWKRWQTPDTDPSHWALEAFLVGVAVHAMVDMPLRPAFMQFSLALCVAWLWPSTREDAKQRPSLATALVLILALLLSFNAWKRRDLLPSPSPETLKEHLERRPYDALAWLQAAQQARLLNAPVPMHEALERALWLEPNFADAWAFRLKLAKADRDPSAAKLAEGELKRIAALVIPEDQARDPYCLRLLNRFPPDSGTKP